MNVSIIVPIYNVSQYIERCIRSVMSQTFTGSLECILVDDVTPDNSIEICEKILSEYKGNISFKIVHHEKNKGLSGARNTGTKNSCGDYLYYLDSDDAITPDCIEKLYNRVLEYPDVELVQGGTESIPHQAFYSIDAFRHFPYVDDNHLIRVFYYKLGIRIPANVWNKLIKRSFIDKYNLYNREGIIHEDHQWSCFVFKHLSKLAFVYDNTYIHYTTPNSIMTSSAATKSYENWGLLLLDAVNAIDKPCLGLQIARYTNDYAQRFCFMKESKTYKELSKLLCRKLWEHKFYYASIIVYLGWIFRFLPNAQPFRRLLRKYCEKKAVEFESIEFKSLNIEYNEDKTSIRRCIR